MENGCLDLAAQVVNECGTTPATVPYSSGETGYTAFEEYKDMVFPYGHMYIEPWEFNDTRYGREVHGYWLRYYPEDGSAYYYVDAASGEIRDAKELEDVL